MKQLNYRARRVCLLVLAAALFMAVNLLATAYLTKSRIDLTEQHLYTLSDGSKKILANLPGPVTLKLYFSNKASTAFPYLKSYGQRVRDLLGEYAEHSKGRINLVVIDPEAYTADEDAAMAAGLKAIQTPAGDSLYLGLVATGKGAATATIPFFPRERETFLEYDITKLIDGLARQKRPVVGVISGLPLEFGSGGVMAAMQGQSKPYAVYQQLQQSFEVRPLTGPFTAISPDISLLFIAHPENLGDNDLYAIDQFVLRGGRALIFVDPYFESSGFSAGQQAGQIPPSSNLDRLFKAWGVTMDAGKVIADRTLAQKVNMIGAGGQHETRDYLPWLALVKDRLADRDPVTAELNTLNLASAGALVHDPASATQFTPLIQSSRDAALIDVSALMLQPDPDALLGSFKPAGKNYIIAARLTGAAKGAFAPPAKPDANAAPYLAEAAKGINVIIVADADMLEDRFWVQEQDFFGQHVVSPMADNGAFVLNAADNLAGSNDLISLRSRGVSNRPFTVVENIRKQAESAFLAEEQRLEANLLSLQKRLKELETIQGGTKFDAKRAAEIESFRQDMLKTRAELRAVQHRMRHNIESLGGWLKFINIGLIPLLIITAGIVMAWLRTRRRPS